MKGKLAHYDDDDMMMMMMMMTEMMRSSSDINCIYIDDGKPWESDL